MNSNDPSITWRPSSELAILRQRAELLARIRAFFSAREVLEVETPVLSQAGNPDVYIESFTSRVMTPQGEQTLYLQTSPEFHMKRLLAAGSGAIYQVCKSFRLEEQGRLHNPEFTMLEWYRPGFDHHQLMQEIEDLLVFLGVLVSDAKISKASYQSLFEQYVGLNPHDCSREELVLCIDRHAIPIESSHIDSLNKDDVLSLLLTHIIEPAISHEGFMFVYDYPASQASLALLSDDPIAVAQRFELYADGVELANGFQELTDAHEQARRFEQEKQQRVKRHQTYIDIDQRLIEALKSGLPDCAGVALGFDRLVMYMTKSQSLQEVMAFPFNRA